MPIEHNDFNQIKAQWLHFSKEIHLFQIRIRIPTIVMNRIKTKQKLYVK